MLPALATIVGHESQLTLLEHLFRKDTIGGTYLFCGPENVGKETVALALAKALLCEVTQAPGCGTCKSCRETEALAHPDLTVLSPEGKSQTIKQEKMEELLQRARLKSYHGGWRVAVLREAHHMHHQSSPMLLKLLEEQPPRSVFILVSHKEEQILPTVRSRCKIVPFFPLSESLMEKALAKEDGLGEAQNRALRRLAGGRLGLALRITRGDFLSRRDKILALLENLSFDRFSSILAAVEGLLELAKPAKKADAAEAPEAGRTEERELLFALQTLLRDVWVARKGSQDLIFHGDRTDRLVKLAEKWGNAPLEALLDMMEQASRDLEFNVSLRMILEKALLNLAGKTAAHA